jgi:hypothetical protein
MVVLNEPLPLPDGTRVVVEPIPTADTDFWESTSLDELAHRQKVSPPRSPDDLLGGWPADELDDDFENAFRNWRDAEQDLLDTTGASRRHVLEANELQIIATQLSRRVRRCLLLPELISEDGDARNKPTTIVVRIPSVVC